MLGRVRVVVAGLAPNLDALAEALGAELDAAGEDGITLIHILGDDASDAAADLAVEEANVAVQDVHPEPQVILTTWKVRAAEPDVAILCRPPRWRHPLSAQISAQPGLRVVDVPSTLP
jgi:hypothetical protein